MGEVGRIRVVSDSDPTALVSAGLGVREWLRLWDRECERECGRLSHRSSIAPVSSFTTTSGMSTARPRRTPSAPVSPKSAPGSDCCVFAGKSTPNTCAVATEPKKSCDSSWVPVVLSVVGGLDAPGIGRASAVGTVGGGLRELLLALVLVLVPGLELNRLPLRL